MKFSIILINDLSGDKASVYSVKFQNKEITELQSFLYKFQDTHKEVLDQIFLRIQMISKRSGIQKSFFRRESPENYNVFRLMETDNLRLYCILFSNVVLLFGSGGTKLQNTRKLVQNPLLEAEVKKLMKIEDAIKWQFRKGTITLTSHGFDGDLDNFEF